MEDNSRPDMLDSPLDRDNVVHQSAIMRQMWLSKHRAHSQKQHSQESPLPQEIIDDEKDLQLENVQSANNMLDIYKSSLREPQSIDISKRSLSIDQDIIKNEAKNNQLILPLKKQQVDSNLSVIPYSSLKKIQQQKPLNNLKSTSFITPLMDQISLKKNLSGSRESMTNQRLKKLQTRHSQQNNQNQRARDTPTDNPKESSSLSKLSSALKILMFYSRFCTMLSAMLVYLRPSRLSHFQLKMISDASHGSVAHQVDGLAYKCFNIKKFMYTLKFEYGFLRDKATYQRFQKIFTRIDNILYFFVEVGILFKKALNFFGAHLPCISPFSLVFLLWELFILVIILHLFFMIPYRVGFIQSQEPSEKYLNLEFYFLILDSVIKFNKKTYIEGSFTQDRYKIFYHYLQNEAIYDFLSTYVLKLSPKSWWTLVFFIKFVQLNNMVDKVKQDLVTSEKLNSLIDLIILLYRLLMFTHIFACLWNWIGIQEQNSGYNNWISYYGADQLDTLDHYISALYYSVVSTCTVGYGDITPQSMQERAFTIAMLLISSVFVGYNINAVGLILESLNKQDKQLTDHLRRVNVFMRTHKIDKELQDKTRKAIVNHYLQQEMNKRAHPINQLEGVSKFLKDEILCNAYMQAVRASPFFSSCSLTFQQKLALQFQEQFYTYEEEIVKQNEEKDYTPTIYYIAQGRVDLYLQIGGVQKIVKQIGAGEYFGQQEFFTGANASTLSVKSTDMTYVYYLTLQNFLKVAKAFPQDKQLFLHNHDSILYRKDYSVVGVKCWGCDSPYHTINDCPIFFYGCRRRYVHYNITRIQKQFDKNFHRRTLDRSSRHKTLQQQYETALDAQEFIQDNDSLLDVLFENEPVQINDDLASPLQQQQANLTIATQKSGKPELITQSKSSILQFQAENTPQLLPPLEKVQPFRSLQAHNQDKSLPPITEIIEKEQPDTIYNSRPRINSSASKFNKTIDDNFHANNNNLHASNINIRTSNINIRTSNINLRGSNVSQLNNDEDKPVVRPTKTRNQTIKLSMRVLKAYQRAKQPQQIIQNNQNSSTLRMVEEQNAQATSQNQNLQVDSGSEIIQSMQNLKNIILTDNHASLIDREQLLYYKISNYLDKHKTYENYMIQNNYDKVIHIYTYLQQAKLIDIYFKEKQTKNLSQQVDKRLMLGYFILDRLSEQRLEILINHQNEFLDSMKIQRPTRNRVYYTSKTIRSIYKPQDC